MSGSISVCSQCLPDSKRVVEGPVNCYCFQFHWSCKHTTYSQLENQFPMLLYYSVFIVRQHIDVDVDVAILSVHPLHFSILWKQLNILS